MYLLAFQTRTLQTRTLTRLLNHSVLALGLAFFSTSLVFAQNQSRTPSVFELQSKESSTDLPQSALPGAQQRTGASRAMLGKKLSGGNGLTILEKPAPQQPGLKFTTQVETKIENKTTNHVAGGGHGGPGGERAEAPPPAAPNNPTLWVNDFERLVSHLLGRSVPLFGDNFFSDPEQFRPNEAIAIPDSYVLSIGDEISTRAWGEIDIDHSGSIDRDGNLFLPRIGTIKLAGTKLGDLNSNVRKAIEANYRNFQTSVSLNTTRTITIHAVGLAKKPGTYQISAFSNLIDAILAVGGPSPKANYRKVSLVRNGLAVAELDLYQFMLSGQGTVPFRVLPNDTIVFRQASDYAAMIGLVSTPGIFQLRPDTTLEDLLTLAGGFHVTARTDRVLIERTDAKFDRISLWVEGSQAIAQFPVQSGDIVTVIPSSPKLTNVVSVQGQVAVPLRQPWKAGMRVSDLIPSPEFLINPSLWMKQNERTSRDRLAVDAVKPSLKPTGPNIHWEYASVERIDPLEQSTSIIALNLRKAIGERDPQHDIVLQPGDVITIYSRDDLKVASNQRRKHIRVEGEVVAAGVYPINDGDTLSSILQKAGGLGRNAYLFGIEILRESTREHQQLRLQEVAERLEADSLRASAIRARSVGSTSEADVTGVESDAMKALATKLRNAKANGRVVLSLNPMTKELSELPELELEDLDTIHVPRKPSTVSVVGSVIQPGNMIYQANRTLQDYIELAGGRNRWADRAMIYIIRADGSIQRAGDWVIPWVDLKLAHGEAAIFPGDTIVVPESVTGTTIIKGLRDWTQVLYQFGLGAAGLKILQN